MVCLNLNCLKVRHKTPNPPNPPNTSNTPTVPVPQQSVPLPVPLPVPVQQTNNNQPPNMSNNEEGSGSDSVGEKKSKFLCSFGGKILPRPDGQLVYAGGDTRVIAVPRSISFSELKRKIEETYKTPRLIIKYRITPEDLDALVSVTSDDDLAFMWDEQDKLSSLQVGNPNSSSRLLRLFIFQKSPKSPPQMSNFQNYLDAINCRPAKLDASSARHLAVNAPFHRVMSTPNLTCCGGVHQNQKQGGFQHCGHPRGGNGMEGPVVVRRGSCQNLITACCNSSYGPGLHGPGVQMVQKNSGAVYGKYGQEAGPSGGTPAGKPQSRAGTPVRRPIIWD